MLIVNGLLALPGRGSLQRGDIRVKGERISDIATGCARGLEPERGEIPVDASGLIVLPGAVDPHVHFDEPGFEAREDFLHGTMEAVKGGVTTVIDMPCTSLPPVTDRAALERKLAAVRGKAVCDYALYGGVSGHSAAQSLEGAMADLAGLVVGYKCYFVSGMETFTAVDHELFPRVLAEAERLGRPLLLHAEDSGYVRAAEARLAAERVASGRAPSWNDYLRSRPREAELVAVASALALARGRESSLHIVHVGTSEAAAMTAAAGASCETCAHYLAFTEEDFVSRGAALKTAPPVKSRSDREGLWRLLASGAVSFLASDHAPCLPEEKDTGNPLTAYGGIPGVGTGYPFLISEGLLGGRLPFERFLEATSLAAARRYGLAARKGSLEAGKDADIVMVDPSSSWTVRGEGLFSKGRITPFEGMRLSGRIVATFVRGRMAYSAPAVEDGSGACVAEPGSGKFISWGYR